MMNTFKIDIVAALHRNGVEPTNVLLADIIDAMYNPSPEMLAAGQTFDVGDVQLKTMWQNMIVEAGK